MQPKLLQTIDGNASLVRVADGIAYAAVGNQLQSYDLLTGELLQTLTVGSNNITGLALDGSFLYTLDSGNTLQVIDISNPLMVRTVRSPWRPAPRWPAAAVLWWWAMESPTSVSPAF